MFNLFNKIRFNKITFNTIIVILLIFYYYKLYLEFFIPISGDELNSILVYSSNIKTLFLKNFAGNVTFFHLVGYIKSLIIGYDLVSYRSITFIFVILHFWILKKLNYSDLKIVIFFCLLILTNFSLYAGIYVGYIFSSSIFITIFYLINTNEKEKNNKLILLLLFVQFYNHLVNIYLVFPIILSLFFFSNKKKFLRESFIWFICPVVIFYTLSIILTGISAFKISDTSLIAVSLFFLQNFPQIFLKGFNGIFFYEGIVLVNSFNIKDMIIDLFYYDRLILLFFLLSSIVAIYNFKIKKKNLIFSSIIVLHLLLLVLLNKQPPPRIFTGFYCFYILIFFNFFEHNELVNKIIKLKIIKILGLLILSFLLLDFDFSKFIKNGVYARDITYKENNFLLKILEKNCSLKNYSFGEMQKRNFYFNYLNKCNKEFSLSEFLTYYRS